MIEAGDKFVIKSGSYGHMNCLYDDEVYVVDHVNEYGGVYYMDINRDCKCSRCLSFEREKTSLMKVTNALYVNIVEKRIVGERDNKLNQLGV